jgi:hypothetical protein
MAQTPRQSQEAKREAKGAEGWQRPSPHISSAAITPRFLFYDIRAYSETRFCPWIEGASDRFTDKF